MKKLLLPALILLPTLAQAHGVAGNRVFPATLEIEDPAVEDEVSLPKYRYFQEKQDDGSYRPQSETSVEYSKRITENFGLSAEGTYLSPNGQADGFDNFGVSAKYQILQNAPHETLVSVGLDWDIGGTGSNKVGAEKHSTLSPTVYFGKGFGDLPSSVNYLKPLALTGQMGVSFPTNLKTSEDEEVERNATTFNYGFSLQYSLPYLQQHVKDVGIPAPFNNLVPLVEVNFQTPVAHNDGSSVTTGTINPGVIWMGTTSQVSLEAVLPVNHNSGHGVGVMTELHFFLDDFFPTTLGKPIFD